MPEQLTEQKIGLAIVKPTGANERKGMGNNSIDMLNAGGVSWRMTARVGFADIREIPDARVWYRKNRELGRFIGYGTEAQMAIMGLDVLGEYEGYADLIVARKLGFDECNLWMGVTEREEFGSNQNRKWERPEDFIGHTIVTSYQNGTGLWLDRFKIPWYIYQGGAVASDKVAIRPVDGDSESIVNSGSAHGAYEVVSSGDSMYLNHMRILREERYEGLKSEAALVINPRVAYMPNAEEVLFNLSRSIMIGTWQTQHVLLKYHVDEKNAPAVLAGVPARESATLMPLAKGGLAAENLVLRKEADKWERFIREHGGREVFQLMPDRSYPNWDDKEVAEIMRSVFPEWQPTPPPLTEVSNSQGTYSRGLRILTDALRRVSMLR
jgi:ATP phosphoribosyltransferase